MSEPLPPQAAPLVPARRPRLIVAALILGIIGLATCLIPFLNVMGGLAGTLGLIFGILGLVKVGKPGFTGRGMAIAAVICSALALAGTVLSGFVFTKAVDDAVKGMDEAVASFSAEVDDMTGANTDKLLADAVEVTLGEFTVTDEDFGTTELPVSMTNKTEEAASYYISIEATDASGKRLADDFLTANNLAPGQAQDFKAFQFVTTEDIEALKTASFKVFEVSKL